MKIHKIIALIFLFTPFLADFTKNEVLGKGVSAGTRITNRARVEYTFNFINYQLTNSVSTQVVAVYGMNNINNSSNGYIYPGGLYSFTYSITNNGNTDLTLFLNLSNFNSASSNSVTNWRAYIIGLGTIQTLKGTNLDVVAYTNNILEGATISFTLYIRTSPNSLLLHSGFLPMVLTVTGKGTNLSYMGDNGISYGGTNYNRVTPRVTILSPIISLRKTLSISNQPAYLARGGVAGIPVPDSILVYTNHYDNDGNAKATNLVIIDTIPADTDFITGSIVINGHTNSSGTPTDTRISYYYGGAWNTSPAGPTGPFGEDRNVRQIRIRFLSAVGVNNGDTRGIADGSPQDIDAGYFYYKVVVHRRRP